MNLFQKKDSCIIDMWQHNGWGNSIYWSDWEKREVTGWLKRRPQKGDILRSKMSSGQIATFKFIKISKPGDPPNMFFAKLKDLKYIQFPSK